MIASILLAALLFPLQAGKAEAPHWETVVSEDGRYSVEMPATPNVRGNRSRNGPDGQVRIQFKGARTGGGTYLVQKADFPTNLIAGTEDTQLDTERDELARQYGGTPTGEKKVTLEGGSRGREFTIRGKPRGELGVITVRVREYMVGKSIYAMLVTSMANRELPDDADRFLGSLKLLTGTAAKPAATPKLARKPARPQTTAASPSASTPAGGALEGWGTAVDPDGDCKIHSEGKTLVIDVPRSPHYLQELGRTPNAPHVYKEVDGDFEVQVKVVGMFKPSGPSERLRDTPSNGAGLVLFRDADNFITVQRLAFLRKGTLMNTVALQQRTENRGQGNRTPKFGSGAVYLRLARKGKTIEVSASTDGTTWEAVNLKPIEVDWPDHLKVALVAINSSQEPFSVTFEEFSFKE
jgi:regulation of enolase protein 1 (concanavalin A-like superfamily)